MNPRYIFALTGSGVDAAGVKARRNDIKEVIESHGHSVTDKVDWRTDYLVASRHDTTKADAARSLGVKVIPYEHMWDLLGYNRDVAASVSGWGNAPVPHIDMAEQLKDNPLFGSF